MIDSCEFRDRAIAVQALIALGREQEAIAYCLDLEKTIPLKQLILFAGAVRASLEGDRKKSLEMLDRVLELSRPRRSMVTSFLCADGIAVATPT